jgi:hypothetical protein
MHQYAKRGQTLERKRYIRKIRKLLKKRLLESGFGIEQCVGFGNEPKVCLREYFGCRAFHELFLSLARADYFDAP